VLVNKTISKAATLVVATVAASLVVALSNGVAIPAVSAADSTARTTVKKSLTLYAQFTSRQVANYGNAQGVGNLTVTQGELTDSAGEKVGTLTTVIRVISPAVTENFELRDTQSQIQLKDGQIFAQAVNEDPASGPPNTVHVMPVTGGTGAYLSARGTLTLSPMGDKYLMKYDLLVEKSPEAKRFAFNNNVVRKSATGDAPQGIGDVDLARAKGGAHSYVTVATRVGSESSMVTHSIDMEVVTESGSLTARTIARTSGAPKAQTFAILGGTGSYAGYAGELRLSADGRSISAKLVAPKNKSTAARWLEDNGTTVTELDITGGTFLAATGKQFRAQDPTKESGEYTATRITYQKIDGVTPIATMLQQRFPQGTMIVSGITFSAGDDGKPVFRPIIGGMGQFSGANGQVSSVQESDDLWLKNGRIWR
jgi:hypothetical protein